MTFFIAFALLWIVLGIFDYGYSYNHFQMKYPTIAEEMEQEDFRLSVVFGFSGPFSLLASLILGLNDYGFRFRRYKYINGVRQP